MDGPRAHCTGTAERPRCRAEPQSSARPPVPRAYPQRASATVLQSAISLQWTRLGVEGATSDRDLPVPLSPWVKSLWVKSLWAGRVSIVGADRSFAAAQDDR